MRRKEFLCESLKLCGGSSALLFLNREPLVASVDEKSTESCTQDRDREFFEQWVTSLMETLEEQLDETARNQLMQTCGRACAHRNYISIAERHVGDVPGMFEELVPFLDGPERNYMEGDTIHIDFDGCACPVVKAGPAELPDTYCECSKGWMLEMFETTAQKPVEVEVIHTVLQGAPSCKFVVRI